MRLLTLLFLLASPALYAQPVPDHYWTMDEPLDVRWDHVGGWHAMPSVSEPSVVAGRSGSAFQIVDGKGLMIALTDTLGGTHSFTVAVWAKATSNRALVTSWDWNTSSRSFFLETLLSGRLQVRYSTNGIEEINSSYASSPIPNDGTTWKLYWMQYDASAPSISVAQNDGAWVTTQLSGTLFPVQKLWFGGRTAGTSSGAVVDDVMLWEEYVPSDAERADIYANHTGPAYFGIDTTPPQGPLAADGTLVDSLWISDSLLIEQGQGPGLYYFDAYPLHEWNPTLAADSGNYVWFRSSDHSNGTYPDGVYLGYSDSPSVLPDTWALAVNTTTLEAASGNDWGAQLETPDVTYHPDDPDGKSFYLTAHTSNVSLTLQLTGTIASQLIYQETVRFKSADLVEWTYDGIALPSHPRTYLTSYADSLVSHTGYAVATKFGEGWRVVSLLNDSWPDAKTFTDALLPDGTRGSVTIQKRSSRYGWWESENGSDWTLVYGDDPTERDQTIIRDFFDWNGKKYGIANGEFRRARVFEVDEHGKAKLPGWPVKISTPVSGPNTQMVRALVENDTLHVYVKHGVHEPTALIRYYTAPLRSATETPEGKLFAYDAGCLSTNYVLPEDFGTLTPGAAADSTQRAANTTAINAAIAAAPAGGSVCLPADSLFLTLDRAPTSYSSEGIILIARDSVALWGAGACGWGNMGGCSYIGTPGDQYYYRGPVNDDGKDHLVRGFGIKLVKPSGVNSLPHITLKGFELDGQSGWTGCYSFSYDWLYSAHWNCWDMGHKGIGIGSLADNLLIEDVKVHSYKGEVIYGNEPESLTLRRVWSYDSNGSAYNVSSAQTTLVEDSKFGPDVRFWTEVLAEHKTDLRATFRNNVYEGCKITNGCIAIAADNAAQAKEGQVWTWENNSFSCSEGQRAFYLKSGKYTGVIKDNTIDGCQLFITGNGGFTTNLQITGNTGNSGTMIFQYSRFAGIVSGNHFIGGRIYSVNNEGAKLGGLVIENNIYDGGWAPKLEGSAPNGAVLPLVRNNTYLNFNHERSDFYHLPHTGCPSYDYADFRVWSTPDHISLCTLNADGQRVYLKGKGTLPADSVQHGWTEDLVLDATVPVEIEFDRDSMTWFLVGEENPSDVLTGGTLGSGSGSHTAPATGRYQITGRGQGIYRTQREGYALRKPIADGDSFSVQIDSLTTWEGPYERLQGGGIVISDSTSATSPGLYVLYRPLSQWLVVWHAQAESTVPVFAGLARIKAPFEVKVSRTGTAYTVSYSSDGETFTQLAEVNLTLTRPFVGIFASSNNADEDTVLHVSGVGD